jgi:hypothetical protein
MDKETVGELKEGEAHPAARDAIRWLGERSAEDLSAALESLSSCALGRLGEVCLETLRRIREGEPVSDRYVLGLAWTVRALQGERPAVPQSAVDSARRALSWAKPCCEGPVRDLIEKALLELEGPSGPQ